MLSDSAIRHAKPREKPYKISDSGGLYLEIKPNGLKTWRLKYRIKKREKKLTFGPYPQISLSDARMAKEKAKAELREGRDPSLTRKQIRTNPEQGVHNFKHVAEAWINQQRPLWSEKHTTDTGKSLERYIYPALGHLALKDITPPMLLEVLRRIEKTGAKESAHRIRSRVSCIYVYAIASGMTENNPAASLTPALAPVLKSRQPALTDLSGLRHMMREIEAYPSHPLVLLAMRFLALTTTRSGEVRGMCWDELKEATWHIPAERMKMRRDHLVPLSGQALDILDAVRPLTGKHALVFPSPRWMRKTMSDNTLSIILRRAGYEGRHVPHGFRAAFSSIMNERFPADRAIIDMMLAHVGKDNVEAAYNRALHLERRKELAQIWADLLLEDMPCAKEIIERNPA